MAGVCAEECGLGDVAGFHPLEMLATKCIICPMATSLKHYPATIEQRRRLDQDLSIIDEKARAILVLMRAWYSEDSQPAIRADQVAGAVQRLRWALERVEQTMAALV